MWQRAKMIALSVQGSTLKGLLSASIWQVANYIIPLLTFPFLARHLGVTSFGTLGLGLAITGYAQLVTDWGFGYSAMQSISQERNNPENMNRIFWTTLAAKLLLGISSASVMLAAALLLVHDGPLRVVILVSTLNVAGSAFNVDWLLRGLEYMSRFTLASVVGRLSAVPLVFLLVRGPEDVAEAAFASAAGALFVAGISLVMVCRLRIIRWPRIDFGDVVARLKGGFHFFLTTATIALYTDSIVVALGSISGAHQVGLFTGADKVRRPLQGLLTPLSMVFYPKIAYLAVHDRLEAHRISIRLFYVYALAGSILTLGVFFTAPLSTRLLLGAQFDGAAGILRVLSWLIVIIAMNSSFFLIMMPFGLKNELSIVSIIGACAGLGSVVPLAWFGGATGAAYAVVFAEAAVMISSYLFIVRRLKWFRPLSAINLSRLGKILKGRK